MNRGAILACLIVAGGVSLSPATVSDSLEEGADPVPPVVEAIRVHMKDAQTADQAAAPEVACPRTKGKVGCDAYYPTVGLTPGVVDPNIVQANIQDTVCKSGYTRTVRNVTAAEKAQVYARYATAPTDSPFGFEVDHFISLELGGNNDLENLWPEPYCRPGTGGKGCIGAREKDVVETSLAKRMCRGELTLVQAQHIIIDDWYQEYLRIKGR